MNKTLDIQKDGTFHVKNIDKYSYIYLPMCNPYGLKSSITPKLGGDMTIDQNHFLLVPKTSTDLDHSLFKRNVFFRVNDSFTWNVTGMTPHQQLHKDEVSIKGQIMVQKMTRVNELFTCEIESFIPSIDRFTELHQITLTNTTNNELSIKPSLGIPLYGRSADSIRDHRHVTSLLHELTVHEDGVLLKPTFSFDERGHLENDTNYGVFAHSSHHTSVDKFVPVLEDYVGEGGSLLDPRHLKESINSDVNVGDKVAGYEMIAGLIYKEIILQPNETYTLTYSLSISKDQESILTDRTMLINKTFTQLKHETLNFWEEELSNLSFHYPSEEKNGWLKWVTLQPILRRIYGNSFMPHHDYGRGGRGWRDLWQDLLALILTNPTSVREMLINNFKGVRIDGSNATIIGDKPGEFLADRNNIARVWMDHGSWPLITTKLYLDMSGDIDLLFEEVNYFADQFTHYTKQVTSNKPEDNILKNQDGQTYQGTILEHILVQNLVPYYNVGEHNNIRLEDADWNDGLDMAHHKGESVAFTSFYGDNLIKLSTLLTKLRDQGLKDLLLFEEFALLLEPVDQDNIIEKNNHLTQYFDKVAKSFTGNKKAFDINKLIKILNQKGEDLLNQVRNQEWLENDEDGWFNGYYDDDGQALDNVDQKDMTLTGQVFSIWGNAATKEQVNKIIKSADKYLYNKDVGGYKLNTNFNEVKTNMGRLFGFAYGHKENGAMFSHMAVMYANALYQRGFAQAGDKVISSIYQHSIDLPNAKILPGIPEYFDPKGRGMYHFLTGSASWMILTLVTEVFGVKGDLGHPVFEPKLQAKDFDQSGMSMIDTLVSGTKARVIYLNPDKLDFTDYKIKDVTVDDETVSFEETAFGVKLTSYQPGKEIKITLG